MLFISAWQTDLALQNKGMPPVQTSHIHVSTLQVYLTIILLYLYNANVCIVQLYIDICFKINSKQINVE